MAASKKSPAPNTSPTANMSKGRKALFNACMDVVNYDVKTKGLSTNGLKNIKGKLAALEADDDYPMAVFDLAMMAKYLEDRQLPTASEQIAELARTAMNAKRA